MGRVMVVDAGSPTQLLQLVVPPMLAAITHDEPVVRHGNQAADVAFPNSDVIDSLPGNRERHPAIGGGIGWVRQRRRGSSIPRIRRIIIPLKFKLAGVAGKIRAVPDGDALIQNVVRKDFLNGSFVWPSIHLNNVQRHRLARQAGIIIFPR